MQIRLNWRQILRPPLFYHSYGEVCFSLHIVNISGIPWILHIQKYKEITEPISQTQTAITCFVRIFYWSWKQILDLLLFFRQLCFAVEDFEKFINGSKTIFQFLIFRRISRCKINLRNSVLFTSGLISSRELYLASIGT